MEMPNYKNNTTAPVARMRRVVFDQTDMTAEQIELQTSSTLMSAAEVGEDMLVVVLC